MIVLQEVLKSGKDSTDFPIPRSIEETGLSQSMLEDIVCKVLLDLGVIDLVVLTNSTGLSSLVITQLLEILKSDGRIEVKGAGVSSNSLRYSLTDAGKAFAKDAYFRSGYSGIAPVPLEQFQDAILSQSIRQHRIDVEQITESFSDVVIDEHVMHQLGAAMHSGKAVFIYGPPGTGKTFACNKLARLLGEPVYIPHAVSVGDAIVRVFDPLLHRAHSGASSESDVLMLDAKSDPRYVLCERPFITSGGELTAEMLEVQYDESTRQYQAPLQLKATNGIYLIDDLGRQRIPTAQLFNRWIVPMEAGEDFLTLQSGDRMNVPFDLVLVFSTNLDPKDISDPAFLRRIGHKIHFDYLDPESYRKIWAGVCRDKNVGCSSDVLEYVLNEMHAKRSTPLLACHPRDLINLSIDFLDFQNRDRVLDVDVLERAWSSNFVKYE